MHSLHSADSFRTRAMFAGATPLVVAACVLAGPACGGSGGGKGGAAGGSGTSTTASQSTATGRDGSSEGSTTSPGVPGDFTVYLDQPRGPVTRLMYGHNWLSAEQFAWKAVGRFGGNPATVHNWSNDAYATGNDYYFEDLHMSWSNYDTWEQFVEAGAAAQAPVLLVVPTLGWVAKQTYPKICSYPYTQYPQQTGFENNCNADGGVTCCGNGHVAGGGFIGTTIDPTGPYVQSTPADVVKWLQAIEKQYGASVMSSLIVGLDNEPDWWNTTHYDVHPTKATIDEVWGINLAYAKAIKAAYPTIPIVGPDWVAYWETDKLQTYLQNVADYRTANGVQLIDYLDVHFYPSWGKFSFACSPVLSDAGAVVSDGVSDDARLQGPRLFWDPTFPNPYDNMFGEPARLIPRYRDLIAKTGANVKLAITEYNIGTDTCASGAVAQAEALAVFGRYGLDLATRWTGAANGYQAHYRMTANSSVESAFRLFLEHDVVGTSVVVNSSVSGTLDADAGVGNLTDAGGFGVDMVTAYGILNGATINVMLFNKQSVPATVKVQLGSSTITSAQAWGFSVANTTLGPVTAPAVTAGLATITLPAQSATLVAATLPAK